MKNFEFNFNRIKTNIRSSRQISLTIFCAILISVFILTWASSIILATINHRAYLDNIRYNDSETRARLMFSGSFNFNDNPMDINYIRKTMDENFNSPYNFSISTGPTATINGDIVACEITGISENFIDDSFVIFSGDPNKIYTENAIAIKKSMTEELKLSLGDKVNINGSDFTLAAIIDEYKCFTPIFMSLENYDKLFYNQNNILDLYIDNLSGLERSSLVHKLNRLFKNPNLWDIKVENVNKRYEVLYDYISKAISDEIIPIIMVFVLAIIAIFILYYGLIKWRKRNIGIHMSLGARKKDIIMDASLEIFSYMLVSTLVSFLIINIFYKYLAYISSIYKGPLLYLLVLVISALTSIVIGIFSAKKISSKPITEIIGG